MNRGRRIPDRVDVLIAGAGPAGLAVALRLAREQVTVAMVDARETIGAPLRCGEITGDRYFELIGVQPRKGWIRQRLTETRSIIILDRGKSELGMARIAAKRGVFVAPATSVVGVGEFDGDSRSVTLRSRHGERTLRAGCIMAADGVSSAVARFAGVDTRLGVNSITTGLAVRVEGTELRFPQKVHIEYLPHPHPHFPNYFWVIPNGPGAANVGLILPGLHGHKSRALLLEMMAASEALSGGRIVQDVVGLISDARPLRRPYADGMLVLGAAARLIEPLSAGGIAPAMLSGKAAARVYLDTGGKPATADALRPYNARIKKLKDHLNDEWNRRRSIVEDCARGLPVDPIVGRKWATQVEDQEKGDQR